MRSFSRVGSPRSSPPPYRTPKTRLDGRHFGATEGPVRVAIAIFWLVSLGRVIGAIVGREVFGAEATLALMAAVAVPGAWWTRRKSTPLVRRERVQ